MVCPQNPCSDGAARQPGFEQSGQSALGGVGDKGKRPLYREIQSEAGIFPLPTLKAFGGAADKGKRPLYYGVVESGKPFDANFLGNGLAIQDGI